MAVYILLLAGSGVAQNALLNPPPLPSAPASRNQALNGEEATLIIPEGTHLMMRTTSPLHTTSATAGSGVYLETSYPVIDKDQVVIPEHTRVRGIIEKERRPGRTKGRARMRIRFTQLILPNNRVYLITGNLQSLPGSSTERSADGAGTLEPVDQIDPDVHTVVGAAIPGALIGALAHGASGAGGGAAIGAAVGIAKVLFERGDSIHLPVGTTVEMVLQRPLTIQRDSL